MPDNVKINQQLLAVVEDAYIRFADIHNDWPERHTMQAQRLLSAMRDAIAQATFRDGRDVQDDYGNRAAASRALGK